MRRRRRRRGSADRKYYYKEDDVDDDGGDDDGNGIPQCAVNTDGSVIWNRCQCVDKWSRRVT